MTWFNDLVAAGVEVLQQKYTMKSNWGSLNAHLFATIMPCDKDGNPIAGATAVSAPLIDSADMQQQFNWQSPFENVPLESKNPTLAARLQSGQTEQVTQLLASKMEEYGGAAGESVAGIVRPLAEVMGAAEGRSGITKLNSRQVFVGHEPIKFELTLAFRAYQDPVAEVTKPIKALWAMGYPAQMAEDMITAAVQSTEEAANTGVTSTTEGMKKLVETLFPTIAPTYVALTYKGETYKPLVIESISRPLLNPYSSFGDVYATVQISLGTHRSWDQKDLQNIGHSAVNTLFDNTASAVSRLFK